MITQRFWIDRLGASMLGALALVSAAGCVETSAYEQVALERNSARAALGQREREAQDLRFQLAYFGQQIQQIQRRDEASLQKLTRELEDIKAQNQALTERLATEELRRAERLASEERRRAEGSTSDGAASGGKGKTRRDSAPELAPPPARPEDRREIERMLTLQHMQVVEMLARIDKLLRGRDAKPEPRVAGRSLNIDLLDPLGYSYSR